MIDEAYFVYYDKSIIDPKAIVARGIYAIRDYTKDYKDVKTQFKTKAWYVFDTKNGSSMLKEYYSYYYNNCNLEKRRTIHSCFSQYEYSYFGYVRTNMRLGYSRESIKRAVKDTPFAWSCWEKYDYEDMTKFFDLYSKYPCIEYLSKLGFYSLIDEKLKGYHTYRTVNWKGKTLLNVLKITKQELSEIKKQSMHVDFFFLKVLQISKKYNWDLSLQDIDYVSISTQDYYFDMLQKLAMNYAPIKKIVHYLKKQKHSDLSNAINTYKDYIEDCKILKLDLKSEVVLFPKDLYSAHQKTINQIKYKENKKLNAKIMKIAEEIADVEIMIAQLKIIFDIKQEVVDWQMVKLARLEKMIKEE